MRGTRPDAVIIKSYTNLVRKSEGKNPLERPGSKWEDNNKILLKDKVIQIDLDQDIEQRQTF
jgi:hypothetical protein